MIFLVDAFVVGTHAGDSIPVVEKFRTRKAGKNRDAGLFDFRTQPLHELVDGNDVVAVIAQRRRRDRQLELPVLRQEVNGLFVALRVERSFLFEARKKLTHGSRVEQGAGQAVLADLTGLLQNVDVLFAERCLGILGIVLVDELRETQGTSHARWPATDDNHVGFHLRAVDVFERSTENQHLAVSRRKQDRTPILEGMSMQWIRNTKLFANMNGSRILDLLVPGNRTGTLRL